MIKHGRYILLIGISIAVLSISCYLTYNNARIQGKTDGNDNGQKAGYDNGWHTSYDVAYTNSYQQAYDNRYGQSHKDSLKKVAFADGYHNGMIDLLGTGAACTDSQHHLLHPNPARPPRILPMFDCPLNDPNPINLDLDTLKLFLNTDGTNEIKFNTSLNYAIRLRAYAQNQGIDCGIVLIYYEYISDNPESISTDNFTDFHAVNVINLEPVCIEIINQNGLSVCKFPGPVIYVEPQTDEIIDTPKIGDSVFNSNIKSLLYDINGETYASNKDDKLPLRTNRIDIVW